MARLQEKGVRITSEIIRYEGGNCFMMRRSRWPPDLRERIPAGHGAAHGSGRTRPTRPRRPRPTTRFGGHAIVYVSNMDAGVRFYSEKLGLPLTNRYGDQVRDRRGRQSLLAIHPKTPRTPDPGKKGSVMLGLQVDEPMDRVVSLLTQRGVRMTGESAPPESGRRVEFEDEDGNPIYLWEPRAASARATASR